MKIVSKTSWQSFPESREEPCKYAINVKLFSAEKLEELPAWRYKFIHSQSKKTRSDNRHLKNPMTF